MSLPIKTIQSVERSITIMDSLAKSGEVGRSLGDISKETGLHPSTIHHLLSTLIVRQLVEQDSSSKLYRLGIHLIELGNVAKGSTSLTRLARPFIEKIWEATQQVTTLLIFHGLVRTPIIGLDSQRMLTSQRAPLNPSTLHATGSGKLLLAFLPDGELQEFFRNYRLERFTAKTISDRDVLSQELDQIRQQGYALDLEEYSRGVSCISAPIHDTTRRVSGCLDLVFPNTEIKNDQMSEWISITCQSALDLSNKLRDFDLMVR